MATFNLLICETHNTMTTNPPEISGNSMFGHSVLILCYVIPLLFHILHLILNYIHTARKIYDNESSLLIVDCKAYKMQRHQKLHVSVLSTHKQRA
jgi:hypothetical protein